MFRKAFLVAVALLWLALAPAWAGYAYSNNGLSFRSWDDPNNLLAGESYFDASPTVQQLEGAFAGYDAAVAAAALPAQMQTVIMAGLTIACAQNASICTSTIATTWALDQTTTDQIGSVARDFGTNLGLPGGLSTFTYPDAGQVPRAMPGAQVQEVYKAQRDYLLALDTAIFAASQGAPLVLPPATVSLP